MLYANLTKAGQNSHSMTKDKNHHENYIGIVIQTNVNGLLTAACYSSPLEKHGIFHFLSFLFLRFSTTMNSKHT